MNLSTAVSGQRSLPFSLVNYDIDLFSVLFFLKGFLYFNTYAYGNFIAGIIDKAIIFFYLFEQYRNHSLRFNSRFRVVTLFCLLLIMHTAFTGFLEVIRPGNIPVHYSKSDMILGEYGVQMQHLVYGSFLAVIKKIVYAVYTIFISYFFVEILYQDKGGRLLKAFTLGSILALPFVIITMSRKELFSFHKGFFGRLAPETSEGNHVHPNTVGILFLFLFFANLITFFREKSRALKVCHAAYCIAALCFVLLSGARSCATSLVVSFTFLFFTVWRKHLPMFIIFVSVFLVALHFTLMSLISVGVFTENPIVDRMALETAVEDRGSGRLDVWYDYYRNTTLKELSTGVGILATTSTLLYNKFPHLSYGGISHPSCTYIYIILMYGIGGFMIFIAFILKIFNGLRQKIKKNKDVIDYINFAVFICPCVWGLTSYMPVPGIGGGVSFFWIYSISKALK